MLCLLFAAASPLASGNPIPIPLRIDHSISRIIVNSKDKSHYVKVKPPQNLTENSITLTDKRHWACARARLLCELKSE